MKKIGYLSAEGAGGDVFENEGLFFCKFRSFGLDENDDEQNFSSEIPKFHSLEALLKNVSEGFVFTAEGTEYDNSSSIEESVKNSGSRLKQLRELYGRADA